MIIIKNNFIPFGRYTTMNLYGLLFTKRNNLKDDVINHEGIHSVQILELAIVGILFTLLLIFIFKISYWYLLFGGSLFYIWYLIVFIFVRFFHKKQNCPIISENTKDTNDLSEFYLSKKQSLKLKL